MGLGATQHKRKRHGAAARDGWLALTRLRTRTPYAGRGTHGVLCCGGGGPHASGPLRRCSAACPCGGWRLRLLRPSLLLLASSAGSLGMMQREPVVVPKLGTGGERADTLLFFQGERFSPSPGALPCALSSVEPEQHEIDDVASTAFYIGVLCWFLFRHPVTFCILYLHLASFEGSKWCFQKKIALFKVIFP